MADVDIFLTILDVMVDDFCQSQDSIVPPHRVSQANLKRNEVVTLSLFGQ